MLEAFLRYLLFASLAILGPGIGVHRLLRLPVDPALVLPVGTALAAGAYFLSLVLGFPVVFPLIVLTLSAAAVLPLGTPARASGPRRSYS